MNINLTFYKMNINLAFYQMEVIRNFAALSSLQINLYYYIKQLRIR
jgi:hypothetical protein